MTESIFDQVLANQNSINRIDNDPQIFYSLVGLMRKQDPEQYREKFGELRDKLESYLTKIEQDYEVLANAERSLFEEIRKTTKRRNPFDGLQEQQDDLYDRFFDTLAPNFIRVQKQVLFEIRNYFRTLVKVVADLQPRPLMIAEDAKVDFSSTDSINKMMGEMNLNKGHVWNWVNSVIHLDKADEALAATANNVVGYVETYYTFLMNRHNTEGVAIHRDPIVTDLALLIYQNIDAHGEIDGGKDPEELSAYSMRKAEIIVDAISQGFVWDFIKNPDSFINFIRDAFDGASKKVKELMSLYHGEIDSLNRIVNWRGLNFGGSDVAERKLRRQLDFLADVDPHSIREKEDTNLLSKEERYNREFKNKTIAHIVELLTYDKPQMREIIDYVLARKKELRVFFHEENSFYVCRIGQGNPFLGTAPGALEVIPGTRPTATMNDIIGSGFDEIREFVGHIEDAGKWHDLFLATSPSKTTDKSNVLLVGPMGCLAGETYIQFEVYDEEGKRINHKGGTIEHLYQRFHDLPQTHGGPPQNNNCTFCVSSVNDEDRILINKIEDVVKTGENECYELTTASGDSIIATADHPFFNGEKYIELQNLKEGDFVTLYRNKKYTGDAPIDKNNRPNDRKYLYVKNHPIAGKKIVNGKYEYYRLARARAVMEAHINNLSLDQYVSILNDGEVNGLSFLERNQHVHHIDENILNDALNNLVIIDGAEHNSKHAREHQNNLRFEIVRDKIVSIKSVGKRTTYDIKMSKPYHNYVANNFVVHNCGKSEMLRAVGCDKNSLGIYAQGSDFLTCWKGEAEKNPKRLFEAAVKLQRESKKHVHILIDEIDSVLKKPEIMSHGDSNLSLEFQMLMDGVVHYPHLSVWGTTNHPEHIPMPMIRRFSKVLIVGELNIDDRETLLKTFIGGNLPVRTIKDGEWRMLSSKLEGATGDIVRKIADHLWRTKMSWFVSNHEKEAEEMIKFLNRDGKFEIDTFSKEERAEFREKLSNFFEVSADDINKAIDVHLRNPAINAEIETAQETYDMARRFLDQLDSGQVE